MTNTYDYILVKDKDGQMKYYKDGKYFSIEEIENGEKKVDAPKEKKATFIDDEVVHDEHMKAAKSELDKQVDLTIDKITGGTILVLIAFFEVNIAIATRARDKGLGIGIKDAGLLIDFDIVCNGIHKRFCVIIFKGFLAF